jgi:hypothetical protein
MIDSTPDAERLQKEHHWLYWVGWHIREKTKTFVQKHKKHFAILSIFLFLIVFVFRATVQPAFIILRLHTFDLLVVISFIVLLRVYSRKLRERGKRFGNIWKLALFAGVALLVRCEAYNYLALYFRYRALHELDLTELPTTAHERVQPIVSLRMLADGVMDQNRHPSEPDFVRIGDAFRFTMAIEPDSETSRLFGTIDEIFDIPGDAASPDFSKESREQVKFPVGEHMLLGNNTHTATIMSFGLFRFFSYSPGDVRYVKDDDGEMVEVVSLSRLGGSWWSRWIFPWPEFGGVEIIHQDQGGIFHAVSRLFFGEGEWIRPEDISKYSYLKGQNLVPYDVSRYAAQSFRYERSFFAPLPFYHTGDTMIPELPNDRNEQPFTIYAEFGPAGDERNKLYHYFALEPRQLTQHGLSASLFLPADGIGPAMVYRHYLRSEGLHGMAAVASQVTGSDLHVDWGHARPVEHRPLIHDIDGVRRFMWLTTIVVFGDEQNGKFSASSMPSIVLTDARTGRSVWVKAAQPEDWDHEVEQSFGDVPKKN